MKVSVNWLKEYVDIPWTPCELANRLEMTGTAVESVTEIKPSLDKIVTGVIKAIEPHPQADKLVVTRVDAGSGELTIVCGAKNINPGDKVPVALIGAELGGGLTIKKASLRGVESEGMLCSETELELGEDAAGIMILDPEAKVGVGISEHLGLEDTVIEFEITPNRPDCMSMIGIAREVGAITGGKIKAPPVKIKEGQTTAGFLASVDIKDPDLCPRYSARIITGLQVGTSPFWMRQRLSKAGIRPINNLVDITNYILLETGQPLHAFDKKLVKDAKIIVRRAELNENMTTLDGVNRVLGPDTLVIADPSGPVALAGIMGGSTTEINEATTECLLESAYFAPTGIFRTSFDMDLRSEASARFERGTDPEGTLFAADRAAYLIQELAGGKVAKGAIDVYPKKIAARTVNLETAKARSFIGAEISDKEMAGILKALDFKVEIKAGAIKATPPSFRPDIARVVDLIEEIARVYGFANVPSTVPDSGGSAAPLTSEQISIRKAESVLAAAGLLEAVNYAFIDPADIAKLILPADDRRAAAIKLANPVSEAQSVLRTSLLPGLFNAVRFNANYGEMNCALFETGRVFFDEDDAGLPLERVMAAGLLTGALGNDTWYGKGRGVDFFDIKGIVEALVERLDVTESRIERAEDAIFHPGQCASLRVKGIQAGVFGLVHPMVAKNYEFANDVFAFEIDTGILAEARNPAVKVVPPSRYPQMIRDVATLVDTEMTVEQITDVIKKAAGDLLADAYPFDLYSGNQVPTGKKSLAYRLVYRAPDRTLTVEETDAAHAKVIEALKKNIKAEIR
ncbi:MAG: phenylalanine--tRNA ligase subunit beta [Actinomycetota bacterium]